MRKVNFYYSLLFASLLGAEPSAFDGQSAPVNANQNSPQSVLKLGQVGHQDGGVSTSELKNSVEGLQSIVVGQGEQLNELKQQFNANVTSDQPTSLKELNKRFEENLKLQNENFDKINAALSQLAQMIDNLAATYVSKEQLKLNMGKGYKDLKSPLKKVGADNNISTAQKPLPVTNVKEQAEPKESVNQTKLDDVYANAIKDYKANNIDAAQAKFEALSKTDYPKQAVIEYYLGEIAYKKGDYKTAIDYYQKSVDADEKSSFVPMILYHTAYSLDKLGDKASAKKILQNLITNYPDNYLVPAAKKRLTELK